MRQLWGLALHQLSASAPRHSGRYFRIIRFARATWAFARVLLVPRVAVLSGVSRAYSNSRCLLHRPFDALTLTHWPRLDAGLPK